MQKKQEKLQARKRALGTNPLLIGMDIGSVEHAAALMDREGRLLCRVQHVSNDRAGFDSLLKLIRHHQVRGGYQEVHAGFEPTGYYWRNIVYFLDRQGIKMHFIKTTLLKHQRELDDSSQSKNDDRDAVELGMLLREGKYVESDLPRGIYYELRSLGKHRAQLMAGKTATVLRLGMLLDTHSPGLRQLFWSLQAKGLRALLRRAPFPQEMDKLGKAELTEVVARGSRRRGSVATLVEQIRKVSKSGIGLEPNASTYIELTSYLDELEMYERELDRIEEQMGKVIRGNEYSELLLSIPGVGVVSAATFLGELGNPGGFREAGEIVSFCGLDPSEHSSGKYQSRFRISKRGRYLMRTMLYYMALRVTRWDKTMRSWYERKRQQGHLSRKSGIIIICIKLIRIIFAMFRDKKRYESRQIKPQRIKLKKLAQAA